jgi:hypothetical protein
MSAVILLGLFLAGLAPADSSAVGEGGTAPTVRVSETDPFTVTGRHFRPGEKVKIVVQAKRRFEARQAAGADGSFTTVVPGVELDECVGYLVKAEGSRGSRAAFKSPRTECGAPLAD